MKAIGIKIIEKLKRLAGIYAEAGEKRNAAVKALSVVLVFAVVLGNLTVPKMKVKAAEEYTINVTMKFGTNGSQGMSSVPYSEDKIFTLTSSTLSTNDSKVVFSIPYDTLVDNSIYRYNDDSYTHTDGIYTKYTVSYGTGGTGPDVSLIKENSDIEIEKNLFTLDDNTVDVTLTATDYEDFRFQFKYNDNIAQGIDIGPSNNNGNGPIIKDELDDKYFIEYIVNVQRTSPNGQPYNGLVSWNWEPDKNNEGNMACPGYFYSGDNTRLDNPVFERDMEYYYRVELKEFISVLGHGPNAKGAIGVTPYRKIDVDTYLSVEYDKGTLDGNNQVKTVSKVLDSDNNWQVEITLPTVTAKPGYDFKGWKVATDSALKNDSTNNVIIPLKQGSDYIDYDETTSKVTVAITDSYASSYDSENKEFIFEADFDGTGNSGLPVPPEITISYSFADTEVAGNPDNVYEYANDSNNQYGAGKQLVITAASTTPETDSDGTNYFTFTIPNDSITEYPIFADGMFSTPVYNRFSTSFSANTEETGMSSEQLIAVGGTGRTFKVKADKFTAANNYKYRLNLYAQNSTTKTGMNLYIQRENTSGAVPIISNLKKVELEQGMNDPQLYYTFELIGPDYSDSGSLYLPVKTSIYNENLYRYAGTAYDLVRVSCGNETPTGLNAGTVFEKGKVYTISMRDGIYRYGGIDGKLIVEGKVGLKFDVVFDAGDHGTCNSNPVTVTCGEDEDGSWKVPISNIPQVTPESGYVFKGWVAASQPESGNSIFVYSKDQNGYLNTANAYFTIGTFEDTNAEAMSVSVDGYRFVAVYDEIGGPKLNISFSTGGSAQTFTAVSENPDDNGNYTYAVTLPYTSGSMASVWSKGDISSQGTNNITFHVYNNSSCTEASEFGSDDEIYGGETVYIKANVSSSQTYSWAPDASKGTVIRGSGTFTVYFVEGVSTSPLAPGEYTWTTDSDAYSYSANTSSRLYLYSNKSSMVFTITMKP